LKKIKASKIETAPVQEKQQPLSLIEKPEEVKSLQVA